MDWKAYYQLHTASPEEAVSHIHSNSCVVIGHACGEPTRLVESLIQRAPELRNVEIVHMVAMGECAYCQPQYMESFRHNALFVGGNSRSAVAEGRGDYTPSFFYEIPRLFSAELPVDVAMITVAPPDESGMCSLGISVDYTYEAIKRAKFVIAQVNRNMPRTFGRSSVMVQEIDCFVPWDQPLLTLAPPKIGPVEEAIGRNCASLIQDGDTLQLGIGAIPDAVLRFLEGKRDLGIHSEMFSDGVMELMERGIITNRRKTLHPGKSVANFLMGTERLYRFVHENPDIEIYPVDYVNHPMVIAQNDNMVSINSCVQVDLMGQIVSECVGYQQISGVGGQVDFIRGAAMSKNGRAIIAMTSTVRGGKASKIVPLLDEGAAVTTSRNDVDYVVTEYGVARLKGRTLRQRARALIDIAHPDFREYLEKASQKRYSMAK